MQTGNASGGYKKEKQAMKLIKATKGNKHAVFAEGVWATGQPQRYGWRAESEPVTKKTLPVEILEFAQVRKKEPPKPEPELKQLETEAIKNQSQAVEKPSHVSKLRKPKKVKESKVKPKKASK